MAEVANDKIPTRWTKLAMAFRSMTFCVVGVFLTSVAFAVLDAIIFSIDPPIADLRIFLRWTIPVAFTTGFASILGAPGFNRLDAGLSYACAIGLGFGIAIAWVFVLWLRYGPFAGAMSVPVVPMWIIGATSGLVSVAGINSKQRQSRDRAEVAYLVGSSLALSLGLLAFQFVLGVLSLL